MDLKIKDVAELLNVSQITIQKWVEDGLMPTYKIDSQYRFSEQEIEFWVMSHKLTTKEGISPFSIKA